MDRRTLTLARPVRTKAARSSGPLAARTGGRRPNAERETPRVDAWLRRLRAAFDAERGAQSDCARFLAGGSRDVRDIRNRVSMFSRWFRRVQLPDGEHVLAVEDWLGKRKR